MGDPVAELTEAVMNAQRGLRVHTERLASLLGKHKLLLPIAKPVPTGSLDVAFHCLPGPRGDPFCPLFTDDRSLSAVGHRRGWKTNGGPLELLEWSGATALESALRWVEGGLIRGAVLNPFHAAALELLPDEMRGLLTGDPTALRRHLQALPIQPEEEIITRRLQRPLPKELVDAIQGVIRSSPGLSRFSVTEVVSAERDEPSLLLSISTEVPVDGPACAAAVDRAVTGRIPSGYSHMDVMFDGAGTKQRRRH
ncbi:MAG: hypothetical protein L6Q95_05295 [Planctomycetes bacterium]|nr:hypothetical protein [Planctomycetota bacterium]